MSEPVSDTPIVRAVFGSVTHADGTTTHGLHVRNAAGELAYVGLTEEPIDSERWYQAQTEALRLLSAPVPDASPPHANGGHDG